MEINISGGIGVDAQTVMTGRGCVIGQSGSGKSFLAGVIAEELCRAGMPFCVLDTEGEYGSLKSVSQNVIIAGGDRGDVGLDVDFARLFEASIRDDMPVVLDLSDSVDKNEIAQKALGALYEVESREKRPYLVVIEEADKFVPQVVSRKPNVIEEIGVRGRKRGIGLFITTQRPANISKNVLAQCSYGFIGKLTIENDLNALRMLVGSNEKLASITRLSTGEFVPFGTGSEAQFKVKARTARHIGMTPSVGSYRPASAKVASVLRELKGSRPAARPAGERPRASATVHIEAVEAQVTEDDARAYAGRLARRKFGPFGGASESVDLIELLYMPLGVCRMRFPTRRKNEYMEYSCLVGRGRELVRLDNGIRTGEELSGVSPRKCLMTRELEPGTDNVDASKGSVIGGMDEREARAYVKDVFPGAYVSAFRTIHVPVYRITLRKGNRVRILGIDGIYGKKLDLR